MLVEKQLRNAVLALASRTDQRTDRPSYRDARTYLKTLNFRREIKKKCFGFGLSVLAIYDL